MGRSAVEDESAVYIAGAVAGLTMSSCWVYDDWRSARGNGVGIAVVSKGSGDRRISLVRSRVAIPGSTGNVCKGTAVAASTSGDGCVRKSGSFGSKGGNATTLTCTRLDCSHCSKSKPDCCFTLQTRPRCPSQTTPPYHTLNVQSGRISLPYHNTSP
jgi:hypothetical protein